MASPSVFSIPGLFRLNLVIVELPTDNYAVDDRGNKEMLVRKVAFYLQLDPVRSQAGREGVDIVGSVRSGTTYEGSLVGCDLLLDGVESWAQSTLPPELKAGTQIKAKINGQSGQLTFDDFPQTCITAAAQAGFGDRLRVSLTLNSEGNNGF